MKFRIYEVARKMVERVGRLVEQIKEHSPHLADEVDRSSRSVRSNIAEGCGVRGGHRRQHYLRAAGSAEETRDHLLVAVERDYIEFDPIADDQLDHSAR